MDYNTVKTSSNDCLTVFKSIFIWRISNFSTRCKAVGERVVSPFFTAGDVASDKSQWQLWLYPFGDENEEKNFLSLFLCCKMSDDVEKCDFSYAFSLWNNNEKELSNYQATMFNHESSPDGFGLFLRRDGKEIQEHLSSGNDTLNIAVSICNVTYYYKRELYHCVQLIRGFESFFLSENFSDVTIEVDNKQLKTHKMVLSARSKVFSAMFKHDTIENNEGVIKITDISYDVMKEVLRFIYCGKVKNLDLHKEGLLAAANKYHLASLKRCCEEAFWKNFTVDNIQEIYRIADLYHCNKLKIGASKFMIKNIKTTVESSEFLELADSNPDLLLDIYSKTTKKVVSEREKKM